MTVRREEVDLYAAMRRRRAMPNDPEKILALEQEAARLGIPYKRAAMWLRKWSDREWWNYGVTLRSGWFEPDAPEEHPGSRSLGDHTEDGTHGGA